MCNINGCRGFWNILVSDEKEYYRVIGTRLSNTPANYKDVPEYSWLKKLDSLALTNVQMNFEKAMDAFLAGYAKALKRKKKGRCSASYITNLSNKTYPNLTLKEDMLKLHKVKEIIKLNIHRKVREGGGLKNCTFSREGDDWYVGRDVESIIDSLRMNMTVKECVERYLKTRVGVKTSTKRNYQTIMNSLKKKSFYYRKIHEIRTSDAKLFLIKLQQEDGMHWCKIKSIRGVLRPAFQMAVDDDILMKNPFQFELVGVLVNDSVMREAITNEQMNKFLKFVHDDNIYCKYYEAVYILFHTGMRISEFCGLTMKDLDMENRIINIAHQLLRDSKMNIYIQTTKTNAGTRKLPMSEDVYQCFKAILEDREAPAVEKMTDGYS